MKSSILTTIIIALFLFSEANAQRNPEYLSSKKTKNEECDDIKSIPQSSKPDFRSLLAGVKGVVIINKPKINGHVPAFKALEEYLNDMGFESIKYIDDDYELPKIYVRKYLSI